METQTDPNWAVPYRTMQWKSATRWAPETDPQWGPLTLSPRHPSEKKTLEPVEPLHSDFAAVRTNYWFVWPEENWPPDWAWFLPRFFLHSVTDVVLVPCRCCLWLCLFGDSSFTAISLTEKWVFNLVIWHYCHTVLLFWSEIDRYIGLPIFFPIFKHFTIIGFEKKK